VFGGLLAFLIVHHARIPASVLGPMRSSTLGFLGYNVLFGLTSSKIDMAGHVGGLVTGFVAGLLLAMASNTANRTARAIRVACVVAVLSVVLLLLAVKVIGVAHSRIMDDPTIGPMIRSQIEAAPSFNAFQQAINPLIPELEATASGIDKVVEQIDGGIVPSAQIVRSIDDLIAESNRLGIRIGSVPAGNDEVRAMRDCLVAARKDQVDMLAALKSFAVMHDPMLISGENGLQKRIEKYTGEFKRFQDLRQAYFKAHQLTEVPK
jgi:rhomboid protease GluP